MLNTFKHHLKHNKYFMHCFHLYENYRYTKVFTNRDFSLKTAGWNRFQLTFSSRFGYLTRSYQPIFWHDLRTTNWHVKIGTHRILSLNNPCFQLINELRGYTLLDNLKQGDQVIDAGASDGFISRYFAAKVGPKGHVLALEPDPNLPYDSQPANLTFVPACLARQTGSVKFALGTFGSSHLGQGTTKVKAYSLPDLLSKYHLNRLNFIKLDIEGAELEVIADILSLVSRKPDMVVAIASYHRVKKKETWKVIERKAGHYPDIFAKTVFPYHATTYLINRGNLIMLKRLRALPAYNEIYDQVWPKGENWNG